MTFDQAIADAKRRANRLKMSYIVYHTAGKGYYDWHCSPSCWALINKTVVVRVDPIERRWNGSRMIETQNVVNICKKRSLTVAR